MIDFYDQRGVSSSKPEVHAAIATHDKGLFEGAFCRIMPDIHTDDEEYAVVMSSDGAGTKPNAAYIGAREGMQNVWLGIARDSIIMNVDDEACVGALGPYTVNQMIERNKFRVSGADITELMEGCRQHCEYLTSLGFKTQYAGGETADAADLQRTVSVSNSVFCRIRRDKVIDASRMRFGDAIIGFRAKNGRTSYDDQPNSEFGCNGYTNFRHDALSRYHAEKYPETYAPELNPELVYRGRFLMTDRIPGSSLTVGEAMLSPTRTNLPLIRLLIERIPHEDIHGLIHLTGGGQTKIIKFGDSDNRYVKHGLFPLTPEFRFFKEANPEMTWREFYRTTNGSHRLEIVGPLSIWPASCAAAKELGMEAKIIGVVTHSESGKREVVVKDPEGNDIPYVEGED